MLNLNNYKTVISRYEEDLKINKLGACWLFSQSEMKEHGCKRKWSYSRVLNIDEFETSSALLYGVGWHVIMEHALLRIKNNDQCITVDEGIEFCEVVGRDYLNSEYENIPTEEIYKQDFIENMIKRYKKGIVGWVQHWEKVHKEYEIIAIEETLTCPIIDPYTEKIYSPRFKFVLEEDCFYPVGINTSESNEIIELELPYYKIGRVDAIVRKRGTKSLFILDHKTTSSPSSYQKKFLYDIQLASYCALLLYEIHEGDLQHLKDHEIKGVIWDLCHSKIPDIPKLLKNGTLSKARSMPSWIYEQAIEHYGLDKEPYKEYVESLKISDSSYFQLLEVSISKNDMIRIYNEDYATAVSMHETRLKLEKCNDLEFDLKAPRYPICEQYQSCQFSKYCLPNIEISKLFQSSIKKDKKIYWRLLTDNSECITINKDGEQISLPF